MLETKTMWIEYLIVLGASSLIASYVYFMARMLAKVEQHDLAVLGKK